MKFMGVDLVFDGGFPMAPNGNACQFVSGIAIAVPHLKPKRVVRKAIPKKLNLGKIVKPSKMK